MILEELSAMFNPWYAIQQPVHLTPGMTGSFRTLLAAIDEDWQVVEPVLATLVEAGIAKSVDFILVHPDLGQTCQITVVETPEVGQFILANGYEKSNYSLS